MHLGIRESVALARGVLRLLRGQEHTPEVILCPSFTALSEVNKVLARSRVELGAQNAGPEKTGSYTGEVSVPMLEDAGCKYVILGHSERRRYFGETDELVRQRLQVVLDSKLTPIVCVGEDEAVYESGDAFEFVEKQIKTIFSDLNVSKKKEILIAYEPIWAVGTDDPADVGYAVEMHGQIEDFLSQLDIASEDKIKILYGGSADAENAYELLREEKIDGLLIGGASIKLQRFKGVLDAGREVISAQSL